MPAVAGDPAETDLNANDISDAREPDAFTYASQSPSRTDDAGARCAPAPWGDAGASTPTLRCGPGLRSTPPSLTETEINEGFRAGTIGALTNPDAAGAVGGTIVDGVQSPDLGLITNLTGNLIQGQVISNRIVRERLGLSSRPRLPPGTPGALRQAGRVAGSVGRRAGPLTVPFEAGSEYVEQREDGRTSTESAVVAGTKTAGSLLGGAAGGAACSTTSLLAPLSCPFLVTGGSFVGGVVGETVGKSVAEPVGDAIDFLIPGFFAPRELGALSAPMEASVLPAVPPERGPS